MQRRLPSGEWEAHWEHLVLPLQFIIIEMNYFPSPTKLTELVNINSVHSCPVVNLWIWVHPSNYNDWDEKNLCLKNKHPQIKYTEKEEREIWNIFVQSEWMALYPMFIFLIICKCSGHLTLHWLSLFTVYLTKVGSLWKNLCLI